MYGSMEKLVRALATAVVAAAATAAFIAQTVLAEPNHPLDALDANEITSSAAILRATGHTDPSTPILSLTLEPPAKNTVLEWRPGKPFSRRSRAVVRRDNVNREIIIDLDSDEIITVEEIAGPGQPPIAFDEIFLAIEIALANEKMQAGLAKRGVSDLGAVFCAPRTGGNFGAPHEQSRRVVKVDCFDLSHNPTNVFAAPIEGLFAIVDLEDLIRDYRFT